MCGRAGCHGEMVHGVEQCAVCVVCACVCCVCMCVLCVHVCVVCVCMCVVCVCMCIHGYMLILVALPKAIFLKIS